MRQIRNIALIVAVLILSGCTVYGPGFYFSVRLPVASTTTEALHDTATPYVWPSPTIEYAPTASPTPNTRQCVVALTEGDYLRVRASVWGDHVRWLKNGAEVAVIGAAWDENGDLWYQIAGGWVAGWLVVC
jgi:hypothetical protein